MQINVFIPGPFSSEFKQKNIRNYNNNNNLKAQLKGPKHTPYPENNKHLKKLYQTN